MNRRIKILVALVLSAVLAFAVRDLVYGLLVVPLSYIAWQIDILFQAIPELIRWTVLVVVVGVGLAWQLVPGMAMRAPRAPTPFRARSHVEELAVWLQRAGTGTYFKWRMAHRLGRIARQLEELVPRGPDGPAPSRAVADYLAAGMNHSFVDYPRRKRWFASRSYSALDVDPADVVAQLESGASIDRIGHANSS